MADFYPRARSHMLEVWATLECPICGGEMTDSSSDYEDDDNGRLFLDTYACNYCSLLVTYVSPAEYGQYHLVPDKDRRYFVERQLVTPAPDSDSSDVDVSDIPF